MQLASKFTECASRVLPVSAADDAWSMLGRIEEIADMSTLIDLLVPAAAGSMS
jgi:hypothetical protein